MVLSVGEILVDMIGKTTESGYGYMRLAGGAPFNVACGIKKLGGSAGFVGRVGSDTSGGFLKSFAKDMQFDYLRLEEDSSKNTTLAFVELSGDGERDFCFYRKNTADYHLQIKDEDIDGCSVVHLGTLMLSEKAGRHTADKVIRAAKKRGIPLSMDVNYRSDIYASDAKAVEIYKKYIKSADIIKFSEDELSMLTGISDVKIACESFEKKNTLICVTLGARGSAYFYNGIYGEVSSIEVKPVDTTGAGDAFYAGVLHCIDKLKGLSRIDKEKLNEIFYFANVCGALTTLKLGAIDAFPDNKTIQKYLK